MARTGSLSWTERRRGKRVFEDSHFLAVGMVVSIGVEARVVPRLCEWRIGTIPVAVLERRLAVVPAGAVQGDRAIVALTFDRQGKFKATGAVRVQIAARLAG